MVPTPRRRVVPVGVTTLLAVIGAALVTAGSVVGWAAVMLASAPLSAAGWRLVQLYRITTRPSDQLHVELDGRGVTVRSATRTLQHGWDGLTARCDADGVLLASSQFSVSVAWRELSPPEAEANVRAAVAARGASGSPGVVTSAVRLTPELAEALGVALLLAGPPADVRHLLVALLVSPLGARRLQALGVDLDALELACGPVDARWAAAASLDRSETLGNPYAAPLAQPPPTWAFSQVVASAARLAAPEPGGTSGEIRPDDLVGALVADVRAGAALRGAGWHGGGGAETPEPATGAAVVLHDDDVTPMMVVVDALVAVVHLTPIAAARAMLTVHHLGRATVSVPPGADPAEVADALRAHAASAGHPNLRVSCG
jgi:ATP-dependent Clp protease adapter protein ClpS